MARSDHVLEARKFLDGLLIFSDLTESSIALLVRDCRFQSIEKGEILFIQSDESESVYIVRSGSISIVLISPDGREMVINEMRSGDMFGELGILTKLPRSTSAIVRSKGEMLVIPSETFLRVLDCEPQFARRLLDLLAHRLQRSGERESALAFMDAQARLARLLLELDKLEQEKGYITISQEELANRTGLIRQTVAKALGKWRRSGWLITGRGRIVVLDYKALEELGSKLLS
jgi:CRP/FNR family transcriptional regulator, cyclic AMP receptor protein